MLAAVAPSDRFENLRNYVIGNGSGGRPTAVRGFDQNARQPVTPPTGALPGVKTPIPTSSSRPGKATNQRIPYSRLSFNFPTTGNPLIKQTMQEGDISFVHRPNNTNDVHSLPGHGANRASTIGNIFQLNIMLSNHDAGNRGNLTMDPRNSPFGKPNAPTWSEKWENCTAIGRWSPDGVIIGTEHQHGTSMPLVGTENSSPGDLWNICVQGPTPLKNNFVSPTQLAISYTEQNIDGGIRVMDKVFVGLFAQENRNDVGINQFYSFYWRPFTNRQLLYINLAAFAASRVAPHPGSLNVTAGPTAGDFTRMVAAWRIGTVMDANLSLGRVQINVCVEEWPLEWLRDEYNAGVGASLSLLMPSTAPGVMRAINTIAAAEPFLNYTGTDVDYVALYENLNANFNVDERQGASTDPFGFGATMSKLEAELKKREKYPERKQQWDAASKTERKRKHLRDPGNAPAPPSDAMKRFFQKIEDSGIVAGLSKTFLEPVPGTRGDTQLKPEMVFIGTVATYAEDAELYASLTPEEKALVNKARVVSALISKLLVPLQLFERIYALELTVWASNPEVEAAAAAKPPENPLDPGDLDPDDF